MLAGRLPLSPRRNKERRESPRHPLRPQVPGELCWADPFSRLFWVFFVVLVCFCWWFFWFVFSFGFFFWRGGGGWAFVLVWFFGVFFLPIPRPQPATQGPGETSCRGPAGLGGSRGTRQPGARREGRRAAPPPGAGSPLPAGAAGAPAPLAGPRRRAVVAVRRRPAPTPGRGPCGAAGRLRSCLRLPGGWFPDRGAGRGGVRRSGRRGGGGLPGYLRGSSLRPRVPRAGPRLRGVLCLPCLKGLGGG